jgi:hypothetical protein
MDPLISIAVIDLLYIGCKRSRSMVGELLGGHDNINQEFESRTTAQARLTMGELWVWQGWYGILPAPLAKPGPYGRLGRKVVNQAVRIFHVASGEVWLVLDDLTTIV